MAQEKLNPGATSLAVANWLTLAGAAGSGVVDSATLNIATGNQPITGSLTWGLTNGIKNLDISPGFSGSIGGSSGSTLAVNTRASLLDQVNQFPRVRYEASGGNMYYTAENAAAVADICHYLQVNGSGSMFVNGTCTVARLEMQSGRLSVAENVGSISGYRWVFTGGSSNIVYSATQLHSLTVTGGQHTIGRGVAGATITATGKSEGLVVAGGQVTLDAGSANFADVRLYGGTLTVLNAGDPDTPTAGITYLSCYGGTLDFSRLQRPMIVTLLEDAQGCNILPSKLLTITARNPIGRGATGLT